MLWRILNEELPTRMDYLEMIYVKIVEDSMDRAQMEYEAYSEMRTGDEI